LLFALSHASKWRLHRIVVALPFISILDQTARILREIFEPELGPNVLVEHHHAIEPVRDTTMNRLASENWDAPLIVTTQVQLFESLFSRRYSRCRKLHNLANSILILDEVQTLPASLLSPIVDMLQDLQTHYGTSLLLTTATQPSLHTRPLGPWHFDGLDPRPVEIVPEPEIGELFAAYRRVQVRWPETNAPTSWAELATRLSRHRQVLAIVHRRQDAAELWTALRDLAGDDTLHLSALMCPAHRRQVLSEIRTRLDSGEECRVVSTQVVEAGVDVDFPVVYRAMAGLEALAQSAGRCNREGRLPMGQFEVFHPSTEPPGILRLHRDLALLMLGEDPSLDLMAPATFRTYFDRLYSARSRDARGIQALREAFRFEETASRFRMIDSAAEPVFVPFERDGERAVAGLRYGGPSRDRFRALQPFGVAIYPQDLREIISSGAVELLHDSVYVLVDKALYDGRLGLRSAPEPSDAWIA
jgi:CRISPR-associated endonuclease/helicase Cas3